MGSSAGDGEYVAVGEEDVDVPEGGGLRKEGSQFIPNSMVTPKTHSIRVVHAALVLVQLGYAGLQMFSRVALDAGLNQFLLSMYRNMIAFAILGPVAYYFERFYNSVAIALAMATHCLNSLFQGVIYQSHRMFLHFSSELR